MHDPSSIWKFTEATNKDITSNTLLGTDDSKKMFRSTHLSINFYPKNVCDDFLCLLIDIWMDKGNMIVASNAIAQRWHKKLLALLETRTCGFTWKSFLCSLNYDFVW